MVEEKINKEEANTETKMDKSTEVKKQLPEFNVGDTIKVFVRIKESDEKFRLQPFEGLVIRKRGSTNSKTFTVRKVSYGEGVERIFPLSSPTIDKIEVVRKGKVKKSKLYFMRDNKVHKIEESKS